MVLQAQGGGYVTATNSGSIDVSASHGLATGIDASSTFGYVTVDNSGSLDVAAYYNAIGVAAAGDYGTTVYNGGSVDVASYYYDATGIQAASAYGNVLVDSSGDVSVSAHGQAYGIDAYVSGASAIDIVISGDLTVASVTGGAVGINAAAGGAGDVTVDSQGNIAVSGYDLATGIYVDTSGNVDVVTGGAVAASASGDTYADAVGVYLFGYDVYFHNDGDVTAAATASDPFGAAYADGVHIDGTYVDVYVGTGTVVSADANGFYANAVGLEANGSYGLYLGLEGDIQATATGAYAWATGVQATSYVDILAYSNGIIDATATGSGYSYALGVGMSSLAGDIFFYNGGNITATAADYAVAVHLDGSGNTVFINNGLVAAYADAYGGIAFLSGDANDSIYNNGTMTGAIVTGAGDDYLFISYGATWNVFGGADSYFGTGDDAIVNYGTIYMSDAVIDLGLPGAAGNFVVNYGVISVSGDNTIDLEGGSAARTMDAALAASPSALAVPSTNPGAFYNYGLIDFQDGVPDDTLTVIGDFGGDGDLALDVSGLNGTGDLLYIDGSVISSSVQTLDIDLLDLPADGFTDVPVVMVTGDSVSGNFVLGSVSYTPIPFVDTSISLVSNINAANTSPDIFNLRVSMTADETGAIAAVLPAGVQLLMNDVVGSWHKRVEGMDDRPDKKFSAWVRLYQNKGKVDPDTDGVVGGDFGFEQKNTGGEAGFDFAPNGRFNFGLILGRANADQNLRLGFGSDKIQGNVTGGYGTYRLPRGFYFDLSHRRLKFDAELDTPQGPMSASGEARTENAESGYSFNIAGFEVETQVQITSTKLVHLDSLTFGDSYTPPGGRMMALADPPEFENDADLSSVKRVGVDIRKKWKSKAGTQWELHWTTNRIRETGGRNDFRVTNTLGGTTDIGGDSSLIDVGFTARRGLLLMYGEVTWQDGGALQNFTGVQLGAKYTW
jgi:hypothetical protein